MEYVYQSSSEISVNGSLSSELAAESQEIELPENVEKPKTDPGLKLDLKCVQSISDNQSDKDDFLANLSTVNEHVKDSNSTSLCLHKSEEFSEKKIDHLLEERIRSLSEIMVDLKEKLSWEIALWRKEKEEFEILREKSDILALEEATAAARAAAAAYAAEAPLSNNLGEVLDSTSEEALRELTILEYEKKLAKYQDAFSFSLAEKRYNVRWQSVAHAYKEKLIEVDRLCNEELEKVRQSASNLQPLKEMVSRWSSGDRNYDNSKVGADFNMMRFKSQELLK